MDKEKIIIKLSEQVDNLNAHINRLKKSGYKTHILDVDILRQKTIELYELVCELEAFTEKKIDPQKPDIIIPEKIQHEELKEEILVKREEPIEEKITDTQNEVTEKVEVIKKVEVVEETEIIGPVVTPPPVESEPVSTEPTTPEIEEIEPVIKKEIKVEEPEVSQKPSQQTAYELFSGNLDNPVAEKFHIKEEQSISDKIQRSHISNIREAIGINEKFLFINELFKGDLGRYNKTLDEINELPTKKGVDTFLFELKIEFQWPDDNEAYIKFKELLERKF